MMPAALALLVALTSSAAAQDRQPCPVARPGAVVLYGEIDAPITLTLQELEALPQVTVEGTPHGGTASRYTGPTLQAVLTPARLPAGPALRGSEMMRYVVVEAADGYRALFALAELDSEFRAATPILALSQNGEPLGDDDGPFQVVVPGENRHARWVRQVTCLRIARDR